MRKPDENRLWANLNRLAVVTGLLIVLKLFTYFFQEFVPVFGQVLSKLIGAFLPFLLAFLIAFLLEPVVLRLMRVLRIRRPYAALLTLVLAIALLGLFVFLIVARLYTELSELAIGLPDYTYFVNFIMRQVNSFERIIELNPQIQNTVFSSVQSLLSSVQGWAKSGSLLLLDFLAALPGVFVVIVVSIIATLLVSSSYPGVKNFFANLLPRHWRLSAQTVSQDLGQAIVGFLRAEVILVSVTGITITIGLLLMGNRYAFTLGFLAGFLDLLPIVGTGMLFVPWIIGLIILGSIGTAMKLLIIWVITMVLRQLLEPKIMARNIGLHPLPTLISMYVGLKLWGGIGLIVGPGLVILYEAFRKAGILGKPKL